MLLAHNERNKRLPTEERIQNAMECPVTENGCIGKDCCVHETCLTAKEHSSENPRHGMVSWHRDVDYHIFWSDEDDCFVAQHNKRPGISILDESLEALGEQIEMLTLTLKESS